MENKFTYIEKDKEKRESIIKLLKTFDIWYVDNYIECSIKIKEKDKPKFIEYITWLNSKSRLESILTKDNFKIICEKINKELSNDNSIKLDTGSISTYSEDPGYYVENNTVNFTLLDDMLGWDTIEELVESTYAFTTDYVHDSVAVEWNSDNQLMLVFLE